MPDYKYSVSLSITHPSIDPGFITQELGIKSVRQRKGGSPRRSYAGELLEGQNKDSFWRGQLHKQKRLDSKDIRLEDYLAEQNKRFVEHREFFHQLIESGGYVEYFVGWFGEGTTNMSSSFSSALLLETSALNIAIGLDVYL